MHAFLNSTTFVHLLGESRSTVSIFASVFSGLSRFLPVNLTPSTEPPSLPVFEAPGVLLSRAFAENERVKLLFIKAKINDGTKKREPLPSAIGVSKFIIHYHSFCVINL